MPSKKQREAVSRRFAAYFTVTVILAAVLISIIVTRDLQETSRQRLIRQTELITYNTSTRAQTIGSALGGAAGFFAGSEEVRRDEFYDYIEASGIQDASPVFSTFAYIERVAADEKDVYVERVRSDRTVRAQGYPRFSITPEGDRAEYWPITYIYPESSAAGLLGADQSTDPIRRENVAFARDSGSLSLSSSVLLSPRQATGFIFAVPIYAGPDRPGVPGERADMFAGAVTIAVYADTFLEAALPDEIREGFDLRVNLYDLGREGDAADTPFFTLATVDRGDSSASVIFRPVSEERSFDFGGRRWRMVVAADAGYGLSPFERVWPFVILGLGFLVAMIGFLASGLIKRQGIIELSERQRELMKERQDTIRTLSHQLRTPLTATRWGLETLLEQSARKNKEIISDVIDKTDQLSQIVDRILFYLETSETYRASRTENISVKDICLKAVDALRGKADRKGIALSVASTGPVAAAVDVKNLRSAISYLIDNAIDYTERGGRIDVSVADKDGMVEIRVKDTGLGIPENEHGRVFEAFFRATNASETKNVGSGVSLSIAKTIIEGHGGTLTFKSREGEGSVFVIRFPATPAERPSAPIVPVQS